MDQLESNTEQLKPLSKCVEEFVASFSPPPKTFAILYAPDKCYLALVNASGLCEVGDNNDRFDIDKVFEARVFNGDKELRWLKGYGAAVISDATCAGEDFVRGQNQAYLLWGQKTGVPQDGWTRFATARIGAFRVPVELKADETYARFTAVEYLKECKDGNVAVVDERLTGIEGYEGEPHNG